MKGCSDDAVHNVGVLMDFFFSVFSIFEKKFPCNQNIDVINNVFEENSVYFCADLPSVTCSEAWGKWNKLLSLC